MLQKKLRLYLILAANLVMCESHPDVASFEGMKVSRRIAEAWHCEMLYEVIAKSADLTEVEIQELNGS